MLNDELVAALPHDLEAERALLGSVLIDQAAMLKVIGEVRPADFYRSAHAKIYSAMLSLNEKHEPIDIITVCGKLASEGSLDTVGGRSAVIELTNVTVTSGNIMKYARMVALNRARRSAIMLARGIIDAAQESENPIADFQKAAAEMVDFRVGTRKAGTIAEWMEETQYYESLTDRRVKPMFTGCRELDELLGGLHRGEVSFIAARPGVGKTTLALAFSKFISDNGFRAAFVTAEMSVMQLLDRVLAMRSGRPVRRYRSGQERIVPGTKQADDLNRGVDEMHSMDYVMVNASGMTPTGIRGALLPYLADGRKIDIVFVDYVQLLRIDAKKTDSRNAELTVISQTLCELSKELDCHVCILSQLSRDGATGEPQLHHLRDSGSLESDANQVIMAWKPTEGLISSMDKDATKVNLKVAKNREGMTGKCAIKVDFATFTVKE
jgi:replicative DNA helicase